MTGTTFPFKVPFPSGRPSRERLTAALDVLAQDDWKHVHCPLLEQDARWTSEPAFLCGSDEERAQELFAMWQNPEASVLWCGRGGYGATRLLSRLQAMNRQNPISNRSRLLGYSDITALFAFIRSQGLPIECVHSPVLTELPDHPAPQLIYDALHGRPCPLPVQRAISAFKGTIWGGNLAVLASLCGTPWLPNIEQGAIFLEDIEEAPYRLDRFVTQLYDTGFFQDSEGVFLGQFTRCGTDGAGRQAVLDRLSELRIAVFGELPVGHEADHRPLFLDLPYRLEPEQNRLVPER